MPSSVDTVKLRLAEPRGATGKERAVSVEALCLPGDREGAVMGLAPALRRSLVSVNQGISRLPFANAVQESRGRWGTSTLMPGHCQGSELSHVAGLAHLPPWWTAAGLLQAVTPQGPANQDQA